MVAAPKEMNGALSSCMTGNRGTNGSARSGNALKRYLAIPDSEAKPSRLLRLLLWAWRASLRSCQL
jgi:hypothetical protein